MSFTGSIKTLGYLALIAIFSGALCGALLGDHVTFLRPIASTFAMLLQMVVLPYIVLSLMHGLGSLSPLLAKRLLLRCLPIFLLLWLLLFVMIYILAILIPAPQTGIIEVENKMLSETFLSYFIPSNLFYDLANNIVPAVAVFGFICGLALMYISEKEEFLAMISRGLEVSEKIFKWIAIISPIGIFTHIAVAIGTLHFENLAKLEVYLLSFIAITLLFVFWLLPLLLLRFTPLNYWEILDEFRFACLLAFATGLSSIAFPFISRSVKRLGFKDPSIHSISQTVIPLSFSFLQIGNGLILLFIFFASFYFRHPLLPYEKGLLPFLSIPMSFGTSTVSINAVSFLLSEWNFPTEAFPLFVETTAITTNFQVLLSVAAVLTFIILLLYAYEGRLKVQIKNTSLYLLATFALFLGTTLLIKPHVELQDNYQNLYPNLTLKESLDFSIPITLTAGKPNGSSDPLANILKTGVLRVGYAPFDSPFSYFNNKKELAGYDIAFAYELAKDLDCRLVFIPIQWDQLAQELNSGVYDIAMSSVVMDESRLKEMDFSRPYWESENVLVVPVARRKEFLNYQALRKRSDITFGVIGAYKKIREQRFPLGKAVDIDNIVAIFQGKIDAVIWSKISASIFCIEHPEYVAIDYGSILGRSYFSYGMKQGGYQWSSFISQWLELKEGSLFSERQKKYWMEGMPGIPTQLWNLVPRE